jgi:hypothetical protein
MFHAKKCRDRKEIISKIVVYGNKIERGNERAKEGKNEGGMK